MQGTGHLLSQMALDFLSIPGMLLNCSILCFDKCYHIVATSTDLNRHSHEVD